MYKIFNEWDFPEVALENGTPVVRLCKSPDDGRYQVYVLDPDGSLGHSCF